MLIVKKKTKVYSEMRVSLIFERSCNKYGLKNGTFNN